MYSTKLNSSLSWGLGHLTKANSNTHGFRDIPEIEQNSNETLKVETIGRKITLFLSIIEAKVQKEIKNVPSQVIDVYGMSLLTCN